MTAGEIVERAVRPDGAWLRQFRVDGVEVQVRALDQDHDTAAVEIVATLHATCAAAAPPAERATAWGDSPVDELDLGPDATGDTGMNDAGTLSGQRPCGASVVTPGAISASEEEEICEACGEPLQARLLRARPEGPLAAPRRPWLPYLSPGWIAAYAAGLLAWLSIDERWGAFVVVTVLAAGTLGIVALGELLATGHVDGGRRE